VTYDAELVRTAYHEAGHSVACHLLGGEITGPVSITPTLAWLGIAHGRIAATRDDMEALGAALEATAVVSLAGPVPARTGRGWPERRRRLQRPVRGLLDAGDARRMGTERAQ
jgi:hypothetical protein